MARVRIGILGAARITPAALIRPARRVADCEIVAVAARDPQRGALYGAKHGIPRVLESYQALIDDPDIDAIYNPLPNGLHGRWTLAALVAGKHVLCEKPFTADAAEARTVAAAAATAAASGIVVMEAFHYRHHPLAHRLDDIMQSGELGDIRRIEVKFSAPLLRRGDIRYRADLAGGALMDMGCYAVNLLRLLAGEEPRVTSARAKLSSPGVDRAMRADFELANDATARISCSMFSRSLLAMHATVMGTTGDLRVFNPFSPQFGHRIRIRHRPNSAELGGSKRVEHLTRKPTYQFQLGTFVDAILNGGPVLTTPEDAVHNMRIIDDIYRAAGMEPRRPSA